MKITNQLRLTVAGLTVLALGTTAYAYLNTDRTSQNATVVNQSGIVRGATQRLVKLESNGKPSDPIIQTVDQVIAGLINGDPKLNLPKATDANYIEKITQVDKAWQSLKITIAAYRQDPSLKAKLIADSEEFFKLANATVGAAETYSIADVQSLKLAQAGILALNLGALAFIFWTIQRAAQVLQTSVGSVTQSSYAIAETVEKQGKIITEQSSSVKDTTLTIEGLGTSSLQAAQQAEASAKGAREALNLSESGTQVVAQTVEGIAELRSKVGAIAEQIMQLSEQTDQISTVSKLVAGIADQTNMLALNAAVEAARAGEQGKGFAVVAGEIRKLADQSRTSADKINTLVADIQTAINSTVMVTDEGNKTASAGIQLAETTTEVFSQIAQAINEVFTTSQSIALSAKQQAVGVQQAVSAINAINLGAKETAVVVSQVQESTQQLTGVAQQLSVTV